MCVCTCLQYFLIMQFVERGQVGLSPLAQAGLEEVLMMQCSDPHTLPGPYRLHQLERSVSLSLSLSLSFSILPISLLLFFSVCLSLSLSLSLCPSLSLLSSLFLSFPFLRFCFSCFSFFFVLRVSLLLQCSLLYVYCLYRLTHTHTHVLFSPLLRMVFSSLMPFSHTHLSLFTFILLFDFSLHIRMHKHFNRSQSRMSLFPSKVSEKVMFYSLSSLPCFKRGYIESWSVFF